MLAFACKCPLRPTQNSFKFIICICFFALEILLVFVDYISVWRDLQAVAVITDNVCFLEFGVNVVKPFGVDGPHFCGEGLDAMM